MCISEHETVYFMYREIIRNIPTADVYLDGTNISYTFGVIYIHIVYEINFENNFEYKYL